MSAGRPGLTGPPAGPGRRRPPASGGRASFRRRSCAAWSPRPHVLRHPPPRLSGMWGPAGTRPLNSRRTGAPAWHVQEETSEATAPARWGRNRVRVFPDPRTGMIQIEWRVDGRRVSRSLGHRDWKRAEKQADLFADGQLRLTPRKRARTNATSGPLTLGTLPGHLRQGGDAHQGQPDPEARLGRDEAVPQVLREEPRPLDALPSGTGTGSSGTGGRVRPATGASRPRTRRLPET